MKNQKALGKRLLVAPPEIQRSIFRGVRFRSMDDGVKNVPDYARAESGRQD